MDKVNNRLFVPGGGNPHYKIFQLDDRGLPLRRTADYSIGDHLIGRGFPFAPLGNTSLNSASSGSLDPVHQRFFVPEGSWLGPRGGRILVFDVHPEKLAKLQPNQLPEAIAVLGQPDFQSWEDLGVGPNKIGGSGGTLIDGETQRLFFADRENNRILVWDIRPENLKNGMDAMAVIGQPDFYTNTPGIGGKKLSSPGSMTYDTVNKRLFVSDGGNHRVLIFDLSPAQLSSGMDAIAVIGQNDLMSREPRRDLRKIATGRLAIDYKFQRLFEAEGMQNRVLVFDVDPSRLKEAQNPDAIAVLGQLNFTETDPAVTQERLTMPRVTVDSEKQLAYIPDGYPARNGITIFDIHPDRMKTTGTPALDQLGHINPDGEPDFLARSANDRVTPYAWTNGRSVTLDTVDHRLFLTDNYGHRVLIFQLDDLNRIQDRDAKWVLGQRDVWTSELLPGRDATTIKLPLAVHYDESHKRLFVADAWNDRVLVYDMTPEKVHSGMPASYVLGQRDFESYEAKSARNRLDLGARWGRGIGTSNARAQGLAVDKKNQRLFVTDGGNDRVLVFDIHPDRIHNGADAIAVIGQKGFTSVEGGGPASLAALTRGEQIARLQAGDSGNLEARPSSSRLQLPGDLAYDENHDRLFVEVPFQHRLLVFNVSPERIRNGMEASVVIGQPNYSSTEPGLSRRKLRQPDGISYDPAKDRLYVSDKGNHRIVVFDARPEVLTAYPEALFVIGEETFDQVTMARGLSRWQQNRLHDPRGSAFDSAGQRLFQSEGLNTRITVFTMPREQYEVYVKGRGSLTYESLDAPRESDLMEGYGEVNFSNPAKVLGVSSHLWTRRTMQKESQRESRVLVSEAILPQASPSAQTQLFFDSRNGAKLSISVVNSNPSAESVRFALRSQSGQVLRNTSHRLESGEQLSVQVDQLFGGIQEELLGSLWIESNRPVQASGLLQLPNGRGAFLSLPAPIALAGQVGSERRILPKVVTGVGYRTAFVLLNPSQETMGGTIEVGEESFPYSIEAGGLFYQEEEEVLQPVETSYAIVRPERGPAPAATRLHLLRRRDGSLQTAQAVDSSQEGTLFWAPINTGSTLLRHQRHSDALLSLVNQGRVPASLFLELFDTEGNTTAKYEQTVPWGQRVELSLEEVFGRSPLQGTLRVFSNTNVAVSLEKQLVNLEGELIVTDIPLQESPASPLSSIIFPSFSDGSGVATELQIINTEKMPVRGSLRIKTPDGEVLKTAVLR